MTVLILLCLNLLMTIGCIIALMAIYFQTEETPEEPAKTPGTDRVVHIQKKSPKFHDEGWEITREHDKMGKTNQ